MANVDDSHPLNVAGPLFTDLSCIDCGTCFHLGPALFKENESDDKSVVSKQPESLEEWKQAKRAILSCPTNSIGVKTPPAIFKEAGTVLPLSLTEDLKYLGYTAKTSFGATSYLIVCPEGNILIDSPKFNSALVKEIEKLGGVKWMFLSHQDDVADHQKFHDHFQCKRVIHQDELSSDTASCEVVLFGENDEYLGPGMKIIKTPGHTKGHMCFLYENKYLFTGDHIFVDQIDKSLSASKNVCWYSWKEQLKSIEKLKEERFEWVLPGHGGWMNFKGEGKHAVEELLQRLRTR